MGGFESNGVDVLKLKHAAVVVVDSQLHVRKLMQDALRAVGFTAVDGCYDNEGLREYLDVETPDLIFVDFDRDLESTCATLRNIRHGQLGCDPFSVVVGLTWNPNRPAVTAALTAGTDDLLAKPVSAQLLRDRVVRQVVSRKEFIATTSYLGPDRRGNERGRSEGNLPTIAVPNNLRFKAAGDTDARADETSINAAMRSLNVQQIYLLSRRIGETAGAALQAIRDGSTDRVPESALRQMESDLGRAETLAVAFEITAIEAVLAAARKSLDSIERSDGRVSKREVELLCLNGYSIGSALRDIEESAGVLATALTEAGDHVRRTRNFA